VIDDVSDLPRIAMLYASVEGFLDMPVLSRVLEPASPRSFLRGEKAGASRHPAYSTRYRSGTKVWVSTGGRA
jgi:hypothetical protein